MTYDDTKVQKCLKKGTYFAQILHSLVRKNNKYIYVKANNNDYSSAEKRKLKIIQK